MIATETKKPTAMDKMRKRALAAVCQYLEAMKVEAFMRMEYDARITYAKGVVCRAARIEANSFNRIGRTRLRALTSMFNKMKNDMVSVTEETFRLLEGASDDQNPKSEIIGLN